MFNKNHYKVMKTIILILTLTMGGMIHSQTIVQEKTIWTGYIRGNYTKSLSNQVIDGLESRFLDFTYLNCRYQTIRESYNVRFGNTEQALQFFNAIQPLFNGVYSTEDSRVMVFGAWDKKVRVWRLPSMWGVKYCRIDVDGNWCYFSENDLEEIQITLNPDYFTPIP